jgi:hypothetical protein
MLGELGRADLMSFFGHECLSVHAAFDRMGVPRLTDGEALSMGQRAELLVRAHEAMRTSNTIINDIMENS